MPHDDGVDENALLTVDDWESHWDEYADTATDNPAQAYRRALILRQIERLGPARRMLDIGSGQGDLLATLQKVHPDASLAGLELSAAGIERAQVKVSSARFAQTDLLANGDVPEGLADWADVAVCSEVAEHVEDPARLLRNAARSVAPGGSIVITVPGGPRTAFDRHIGHRRHFTPSTLTSVIVAAGLEPELVRGHGFPFFNLYKLVVMARGDRVIADVSTSSPPSRLASLTMRAFRLLLTPWTCSSRIGWQLVAVARRPDPEPATPVAL